MRKVLLLAREGRKFGKQLLLSYWTVWKARNKIVFKDDFLSIGSIQKLKYLFLFLLRLETKLSIENDPLTFVGFID